MQVTTEYEGNTFELPHEADTLSTLQAEQQMRHTNSNKGRQHYGTWINEDRWDFVGILQLALKLPRPMLYLIPINSDIRIIIRIRLI